eukprot:COSAG02_NODE_1230_length_13767_cov_16.238294_2_plen_297_part_00
MIFAGHSNFYPHGIQPCDETEQQLYGAAACAADVDSWLFRDVFEEVYSGLGVPFYAALGNHDYYQNANVSAQVAYTQRSPSRQWRMPNRYYSWVERVGEGKTVIFITIDTVILAGATIQGYYGRMHPLTRVEVDAAEQQWSWLESELRQAQQEKVAFIVVQGHYPVHSACTHGPTTAAGFDERLSALLEKFNVSVYLAGHEHCVEVIEHAGVTHVVSGAASECCYPPVNLHTVPKGSLKFLHAADGEEKQAKMTAFAVLTVSLEPQEGAYIDVTIVGRDGGVMYVSEPIRERQAPC